MTPISAYHDTALAPAEEEKGRQTAVGTREIIASLTADAIYAEQIGDPQRASKLRGRIDALRGQQAGSGVR